MRNYIKVLQKDSLSDKVKNSEYAVRGKIPMRGEEIQTDINKGKIPEDKRGAILDGIPLGRIGEPADVAGCVTFLASDLAKYVTGVTMDCNGGMLIH